MINSIDTKFADGIHKWNTYREIHSQPEVWKKWGKELEARIGDLKKWVKEEYDAVWFCGAGTSAFIGDTLASYLNGKVDKPIYRAVATTDIVSQPWTFFPFNGKLLVVSFGRSGNSSESIGTLDALDALAPSSDRLHITCNYNGALATRSAPGPGVLKTLVLPEETDDLGFAMTSSYTSMLLTALSCFDEEPPYPIGEIFDLLSLAAANLLKKMPSIIDRQEKKMPSRAVFLGTGPLLGAAREASLKVLELTAGDVVTLWDSTLGFRHGPKAFVDKNTKVYIFVSTDMHSQRYDLDVAAEIRRQFGDASVCTIGPDSANCDVSFSTGGNDAWSVVLYVLFAQFLAMYWSHSIGTNVDNPFTSGNLTRVVSGVKLYPLVLS